MSDRSATWQGGYEVDVYQRGRVQPGDAVSIPEGEASMSNNWLVGLDGGDPDGVLDDFADGGGP